MSEWDFIVALNSFIMDALLFSMDVSLDFRRFMSAVMDFGMLLVFFGISMRCFDRKKSVPLVFVLGFSGEFSSDNCRFNDIRNIVPV